jgi:hypothetical protein
MNGPEQSDRFVVAMTPPNNASQLVAEEVERRYLAKENPLHGHIDRMQSRRQVNQAPGADASGGSTRKEVD